MGTGYSSRDGEHEALGRLSEAMSDWAGAISDAVDEQRWFQKICEALQKGHLFQLAWFGRADQHTRRIGEPIAYAAESLGFFQDLKLALAQPDYQDPASMAIQTGEVCWIKDIWTHPALESIRFSAQRYGCTSVLVLPVWGNGQAYGALSLYYGDPERLDQYEVIQFREWLIGIHAEFVSRRTAARPRPEGFEAELRQLLDLIPQHIALYDAQMNKVHLNRTFLTYLGYTLEEGIADNVDIIHPDDRERVVRAYMFGHPKNSAFDYELRVRRHDGQYRWFFSQITPIRNDDGEIIRWCNTSTDIHDRKLAEERTRLENLALREDIEDHKRVEEAVRSRERSLRLIIDTIPALVWSAAPDGSVEYVNQRIGDCFGFSIEAFEQQGWANFIHPDDRALALRSWLKSIATGTRYDVDHRMLFADGSYRWYRAAAQPLRDDDGKIVRWYGMINDIEDERQAAELLRRTQNQLSQATQVAAIGELAASIAHEVNQPLAAVVTNGDACMRWLSAHPPNLIEANLAAERIIRDGKNAAEVIRHIRALFQRAEPEKLPLNLNEVLAEVLHLLHGEMLRQGVSVETRLDEDLPQVMADRLQLQQVVFNLLVNGMEAMAALSTRPKLIQLRSQRKREDSVLVEIRDHGVGLKGTEQIFESFFTTKKNGMGMGLAICRSIIDAHNGRLWVAPTDGPGATFCFTLPLQRSAAE